MGCGQSKAVVTAVPQHTNSLQLTTTLQTVTTNTLQTTDNEVAEIPEICNNENENEDMLEENASATNGFRSLNQNSDINHAAKRDDMNAVVVENMQKQTTETVQRQNETKFIRDTRTLSFECDAATKTEVVVSSKTEEENQPAYTVVGEQLNLPNPLLKPTLSDAHDLTSLCSEYTVGSSSDGECVDIAENILSHALVDGVISAAALGAMQSQPQTQNCTEQSESTNINISAIVNEVSVTENLPDVLFQAPVFETVEGSRNITVKETVPQVLEATSPKVPVPSGEPVSVNEVLYKDTPKDIQLHAAMRFGCSACDSKVLSELATGVEALYCDRTLSACEDDLAVMSETLTKLKCLRKLVVKGNNAGPVAVRALLAVLSEYRLVEELDLSDNKADPSCADLLSKFISESKNLKYLNLSGNQLGKESLSKLLNIGLNANASLVHLDLNSCGATNLHGLFEALRATYSANTCHLSHLDISNNHMNDGQQLGIDLSLVLESSHCTLQHLNISDTGLSASGWDAFIPGLRKNSSLKVLHAGGSNTVKNILDVAKVIFAVKCVRSLVLAGIKIDVKTELHDLSFENLDPLNDGPSLIELDISDCGLTDDFLTLLLRKEPTVLSTLKQLKLSNNGELSEVAFKAINFASPGIEVLYCGMLDADFLPNFFSEGFPRLNSLNLRKSRISIEVLGAIASIPQSLSELTLDGFKLSGTNMLDSLFDSSSKHAFINLSLSGCSLTDNEIKPLAQALCRSNAPLNRLSKLDLSVNRLTDSALSSISSSLRTVADHPLSVIDVSNNKIADKGAIDVSTLLSSTACRSNILRINLASNCLTVAGIQELVRCVAPRADARGLQYLDVSNQKDGVSEDSMEEIVGILANSIGLEVNLMHEEKKQAVFPPISEKFCINLSRLGGSAGILTKQLDSSAIKTDYSRLFKSSASLADYLVLGSGIQNQINTNPHSFEDTAVSFSENEWSEILGTDAPAWLKVAEERKKGAYVNHLPGSTTVQRLQGMLEMEADCEVSEVFVIKDPILRKPTGAAWVLFDDEQSVRSAVRWFAAGGAQMYGTPFSISSLPVCTTGEKSGAQAAARRELAARDKQRQAEIAADRTMMEQSQKLADERAEYREAHPAYQNGRIW